MSNIGEQLAFPGGRFEDMGDEQRLVNYPGITYRQWLAGKALSNASLGQAYHCTPDALAEWCVKYADALIAELSKPHGNVE